MTIKLLLIMFFFCVLSCRQSINKKKDFVFIETTMAPIKQDYEISWKDSSAIQLKFDALNAYPKIEYDSAIILFYWGYNLEADFDTASFFPVNNNGKWISTVIYSSTISKADLWKVDSLLGNQKSYDDSAAAGGQDPKYGIVYFKNGKAIGQTSFGAGSQTVRTTFKLPEPSYSQRLNNSESRQIEMVFWKNLHMYGY